jgi:hypothetical protein
MMNSRLLGTLCIIGGAAYLLNGLKNAVIGGFLQQDLLGVVLSGIWALGGICGVLGMIQLRVTGTNRVIRILSYLPIAGFLLFLVGNLYWAMNPAGFNPPAVLGFFVLLIGLLMNGFFTLSANVWTGWKKAVAFLPAIMPFVGLAIGSLIGIEGVANLSLVALSWMLLGYTVTTGPEDALVPAKA